jgi:mRNA interferase MazF
VTSRARGYPFEVPPPGGLGVEGVVLSDHVKSLDWRARRTMRMGPVPEDVLDAVTERLLLLITDTAADA